MEYLAERSNPRAKKLTFYCQRCKAFRFTFEFPSKDILTVLLDSIDPTNILPREFQKDVKPVVENPISPSVTSENIVTTPP